MARIYGQKIALRMIHNALKKDKLHHTLFFQGPRATGKFESALNLAKSLYCPSDEFGFCDKCAACLSVQLFRNRHVHLIASDSRYENIKFYVHLLKENITQRPHFIRYQLAGELANLLHRHRYPFLEKLKSEKKSYPEGIKLSDKQLETSIGELTKTLRSLTKELAEPPALDEAFLEDVRKVQNALDRTIISKKSLDLFLRRTQLKFEKPTLFIIQQVHLIHPAIVGRLLKILEEPPPQGYFILLDDVTHHLAEHIVAPLKSRSFELPFQPLSPKALQSVIEKKWGIKNPQPATAMRNIREYQESLLDLPRSKKEFAFLAKVFGRQAPLSELSEHIKREELGLGEILDYYQKYLFDKLHQDIDALPLKKWQILNKAHKIVLEYRTYHKRGNFVEKNLITNLLLNLTNSV